MSHPRNDDAVTREILAHAIKACALSREQIADKMSCLLDIKVTTQMLNSFTADSKENHRWPFAWTRAFCSTTGDWRLLQVIAEQSGFILLPQSDKDVLALGELIVEQKRNALEVDRHATNIIQRRAGSL